MDYNSIMEWLSTYQARQQQEYMKWKENKDNHKKRLKQIDKTDVDGDIEYRVYKRMYNNALKQLRIISIRQKTVLDMMEEVAQDEKRHNNQAQ